MKKQLLILLTLLAVTTGLTAQDVIPFDTTNWDIAARSFVLEEHAGEQSIYIQGGLAILKDTEFLNGTIEFDVFLRNQQGFPGVRFRALDDQNMESFYIRAHLSGKPDANQVVPVINGISAWQLYFGPRYSFIYHYKYDDWTHVKIVVNGKKAQVFLDYSEKPHLSWNLFNEPKAGAIAIGGGAGAMHYANFKVNKNESELVDFAAIKREPIANLIPEWQISDKFKESQLGDPENIGKLVKNRSWGSAVQIDEGTAANISRAVVLRDGKPGNTVFAKVIINSEKNQVKLFEFGYSDRVVAILNDQPIYKGINRWRSRDYRYLGTVGLFDSIYLNLKKGRNTLLLAVSEDFGGWLVTGRIADSDGITIK